MSVAFRRDSDEEHLEPKFELPIPPGPNYVTPNGLALIEARVATLEAEVAAGGTEEQLKALKRDLRYWRQRQSSAILAPVPAPGAVGIGWDMTLLGLAQHLGGAPAVTPENAMEWMLSEEGKSFMTASGERWREADIAAGTDAAAATAASDRCIAAYTASPSPEDASQER